MLKCWEENPDDRPTFENLRDELKDMENQHKVKIWDNTLEIKQT